MKRALKLFLTYFFAATIVWLTVACSHKSSEQSDNPEDHHDDHIMLSTNQISEFGIEFDTIALSDFNEIIQATGVVSSSSSDILNISAKKNGIITLAPGITKGVSVKKGQRIATISSSGIEGGDISQAANANLLSAKKEYDRLKPLYEDNLVSASLFHEAERAYNEARALAGTSASAGNVIVEASGDGVIQDIFIKSGDFVNVGSPIALVLNNSSQTLHVDVPVRYANKISEITSANFIPEGSDMIVRLSENNGKKVNDNTTSIVENGYIPLYFLFTGNSYLTPGGVARVFLICGNRQGVITVPREALIEIQGNKYVYVSKSPDEFEKLPVIAKASDGQRVEISEGLTPGDIIVSKGASIVRMAEISSVAPPSHTHNH